MNHPKVAQEIQEFLNTLPPGHRSALYAELLAQQVGPSPAEPTVPGEQACDEQTCAVEQDEPSAPSCSRMPNPPEVPNNPDAFDMDSLKSPQGEQLPRGIATGLLEVASRTSRKSTLPVLLLLMLALDRVGRFNADLPLTKSLCDRLSLTRKSKHQGIAELQRLKLVEVVRQPGKPISVRLSALAIELLRRGL